MSFMAQGERGYRTVLEGMLDIEGRHAALVRRLEAMGVRIVSVTGDCAILEAPPSLMREAAHIYAEYALPLRGAI